MSPSSTVVFSDLAEAQEPAESLVTSLVIERNPFGDGEEKEEGINLAAETNGIETTDSKPGLDSTDLVANGVKTSRLPCPPDRTLKFTNINGHVGTFTG